MRRIAMFLHGGVGRAGSKFQMPALVDLVSILSGSFDITVFTGSGPQTDPADFRCGDALVKTVGAGFDASFPRLYFAFQRTFRREHRSRPFDIVHGFWGYPGGSAAVILGKRFDIPSVVSLRGGEVANLPEISYGNMRKPLLKALTLWTCNSTTSLMVSTEFQLSSLRRYGLHRQVEVIPSGVLPDWVKKLAPATPSPPFRFLHVANLTEVKDQGTLLRTFRIISSGIDARLRIIGEDYLNGRIQALSGDLGLSSKVQFMGYVPRDRMREHYDWAHMMLHTSLHEGQGVVFAEAAARGVVVCGTCVGLVDDLQGACMLSVPKRDPDGMATKVIHLLRNPREFAKLRDKAHAWAGEHTITWTAESYKKVYEKINQK